MKNKVVYKNCISVLSTAFTVVVIQSSLDQPPATNFSNRELMPRRHHNKSIVIRFFFTWPPRREMLTLFLSISKQIWQTFLFMMWPWEVHLVSKNIEIPLLEVILRIVLIIMAQRLYFAFISSTMKKVTKH